MENGKNREVTKFTQREKLQIIREAEKKGVKVTLAKYGLYSGTFYYWKKKLLIHGEEGLHHKKSSEHVKLIKKLEKEVEQLKLIVAEKELESRLKDEMLKKKYPEWKK